MFRWFSAFALAFALIVEPASAHVGLHVSGVESGFLHPFSGLDHLLAMLAVGLWAAQLGGRAFWAVPASFVLAMMIGGTLGMAGTSLPLVELMIGVSVLCFGLLVAFEIQIHVLLGMAVAGVFALAHGQAHGAEMPLSASPVGYALGFIAATVILHGVGMTAAFALRNTVLKRVVRVAGLGVAAASLALLFG